VCLTDLSSGSPVFTRRRYPYYRRSYHRDDHTAQIGTFVLRRASFAKNRHLRQSSWLPKVGIQTARWIRLQHGRHSTEDFYISISASCKTCWWYFFILCAVARVGFAQGISQPCMVLTKVARLNGENGIVAFLLASISRMRAHSRSRNRTDPYRYSFTVRRDRGEDCVCGLGQPNPKPGCMD
jgi:hypothetical protein